GSIAAEALRRSDDLVKEGFNLTYGITVTASPLTLELLVPPSGGDEDTVALWFAAPEGELSVRMTGPGGEGIAGWKGRRGEQRFVRALLIAMIDHARSILGSRICPRVLMSGFSASGSFAGRFTMLHPERVLAAAIGSPGGWPLAPSDEWTYPVGV